MLNTTVKRVVSEVASVLVRIATVLTPLWHSSLFVYEWVNKSQIFTFEIGAEIVGEVLSF